MVALKQTGTRQTPTLEETMTVKQTVPPTTHQIADAQEILGNPGQYPELRHQFPDHWTMLKAARGQTVDMDRLIATPKQPLALRILAHARSLGRTRPQPLILSDAILPTVPNIATCS